MNFIASRGDIICILMQPTSSFFLQNTEYGPRICLSLGYPCPKRYFNVESHSTDVLFDFLIFNNVFLTRMKKDVEIENFDSKFLESEMFLVELKNDPDAAWLFVR